MTYSQEDVRWKCEACEELSESEAGPLYECGSCGTQYNRDGSADGGSHRCPDCNKFGAKSAEHSCDQCGEGEVQEVDVFTCDDCGEAFEEESDVQEHVKEHVEAVTHDAR